MFSQGRAIGKTRWRDFLDLYSQIVFRRIECRRSFLQAFAFRYDDNILRGYRRPQTVAAAAGKCFSRSRSLLGKSIRISATQGETTNVVYEDILFVNNSLLLLLFYIRF